MDRGFRKPQVQSPRRGLLRAVGTLFFVLGLIAGCSSQGRSPATATAAHSQMIGTKTNPTWLDNCPGCSSMRQPLTAVRHLTAVSRDQSLLMSFALVVDSGLANFDFTDPSVVNQYYGRATVVGRWRLMEASDQTLCGAPAGEYLVRPLTPSFMTARAISGGTFEAVQIPASGSAGRSEGQGATGEAPARVVFRLRAAQVSVASDALKNSAGDSSATTSGNRLMLNAVIDTVNNSPCGLSLRGN